MLLRPFPWQPRLCGHLPHHGEDQAGPRQRQVRLQRPLPAAVGGGAQGRQEHRRQGGAQVSNEHFNSLPLQQNFSSFILVLRNIHHFLLQVRGLRPRVQARVAGSVLQLTLHPRAADLAPGDGRCRSGQGCRRVWCRCWPGSGRWWGRRLCRTSASATHPRSATAAR